MLSLKHMLQLAIMLFVALLVVACGSSNSTGYSSSGTGSNTASTSSTPLLKTASVTVNGKSETILTNAQGMTLYYFTNDTVTNSACTGTCAGLWPPLLFTGSGSPTSASPLSGTLSVIVDANGQQVAYNGHPLYTYAKDTASGQATGEGFMGKWFVAPPDLKELSAPQSPPASNGY
jgi:predicted lipoprotein with Yx(FWY)xxD motif